MTAWVSASAATRKEQPTADVTTSVAQTLDRILSYGHTPLIRGIKSSCATNSLSLKVTTMKTTKDQPSQSSSQPGNSQEDGQLTPAPHPIAIRFEHLAETEAHLRIEESSNLFGPSDFTALSDDGTTLFSAHGKGAVFGKKREIRDGSGLPIFELHASSSSLKGAWYLELPGRSHERLLSIDLLGGTSGRISLHVHFANRYEHDGPSVGSSTQDNHSSTEAVLEVRGQDMERILFDVFYLGAKVARIRRLVSSVISRTRSGGRPLWEASVSANVDLSIITVSIIALADILLQRHPSAGALAGPGGLAG